MLQSMTVEPPMMSTFDPQNLGAQLMSTQNGEDFSLGEVRIIHLSRNYKKVSNLETLAKA